MTEQQTNILFMAPAAKPSDREDYGFILNKYLGSDTVNACTWAIKKRDDTGAETAADSDFTVIATTIAGDGKSVTIWLTGGVSGTEYVVYATFTTVGTRTKTYGFLLKIL